MTELDIYIPHTVSVCCAWINYFAVTWAATLTAPGGSAAADLVQSNVGKNITIASLLTALGRQGNPQCTANAAGLCKLSEVGHPSAVQMIESRWRLGKGLSVQCRDSCGLHGHLYTAAFLS